MCYTYDDEQRKDKRILPNGSTYPTQLLHTNTVCRYICSHQRSLRQEVLIT